MKILPAALLASMAAFPALARQDPTPPPSGIVIHLFGPNSVTSHILPTTPARPQAAQGSVQQGAAQSGNAQNGGGAAQAAPEPTASDILHQMFVTGDPAQDSNPHFAPGRGGSF